MTDTRSLQELAAECLQVQDACNLSGVVHGWSRSIRRLREVLGNPGTDELNKHPINVLWADKVAHLTNAENGSRVTDAYHEVLGLSEGKLPEIPPAEVPEICPF